MGLGYTKFCEKHVLGRQGPSRQYGVVQQKRCSVVVKISMRGSAEVKNKKLGDGSKADKDPSLHVCIY